MGTDKTKKAKTEVTADMISSAWFLRKYLIQLGKG